MRLRFLLLAGGAAQFVMAAAMAEQQGAPVEFATDPGAAHPKYVDEALATGSDARTPLQVNSNMPVELMMASEPGLETVDRSQISAPQTYLASDHGGFDYGTAGAAPASSGPTVLTETTQATQVASVQQVAMQTAESASPYRQDPIYTITENSSVQPVNASAGPAPGYIRVQPGDTVYALARRYSLPPVEIITANKMSPPYALQVGQVLLIPGLGEPEVYQAQYTPPATQQQAAPSTATRQINQTYIVRPGNTLYSIARAYGLDVGTVAVANGLQPPYTLSIGQQLTIPTGTQTPTTVASVPIPKPAPATTGTTPYTAPATQPEYPRTAQAPAASTPQAVSYAVPEASPNSRFAWPVQGKVIMGYGLGTDGRRNDGINIAAPVGTPIRAAADGEVVYRGSDLEGYGNLLLIKHASGWVSAYAHTDAMLVRKGENVRKGQVIAKVGTTGTVDQPQLHFELRYDLKPTDPLAALEGRTPEAIR